MILNDLNQEPCPKSQGNLYLPDWKFIDKKMPGEVK